MGSVLAQAPVVEPAGHSGAVTGHPAAGPGAAGHGGSQTKARDVPWKVFAIRPWRSQWKLW